MTTLNATTSCGNGPSSAAPELIYRAVFPGTIPAELRERFLRSWELIESD